MRVCIITFKSFFLENPYVFPYLGALTLVNVAKESGFDVQYIDDFEIDSMRNLENFDLIAISCFTPQARQAYKVSEFCKPKNIKVIIGGSHASYYSEECKKAGFDLVVAGDGEEVFRRVLNGEEVLDGRVIYGRRLNLQNEVVPYRSYDVLGKYKYYLNGDLTTTMVTARGCPNKCSFCESAGTICSQIGEKRFVKELRDIKKCGYNSIMIFDDIFTLSMKRLLSHTFLLSLSKFKYRCFVHANIIAQNPEMIEALQSSGCVEVGIGVESASNRILKRVNKRTCIEEIEEVIANFINAGIRVKAFFMAGLPEETYSEMMQTVKFISEMKKKYGDMFDFDYTIFFPYKGTAIGDAMRRGKFTAGIRPVKGLDIIDLDNGEYGAYKKYDGKSDCIIETIDKNGNVLLAAKDLVNMTEETKDSHLRG